MIKKITLILLVSCLLSRGEDEIVDNSDYFLNAGNSIPNLVREINEERMRSLIESIIPDASMPISSSIVVGVATFELHNDWEGPDKEDKRVIALLTFYLRSRAQGYSKEFSFAATQHAFSTDDKYKEGQDVEVEAMRRAVNDFRKNVNSVPKWKTEYPQSAFYLIEDGIAWVFVDEKGSVKILDKRDAREFDGQLGIEIKRINEQVLHSIKIRTGESEQEYLTTQVWPEVKNRIKNELHFIWASPDEINYSATY